MGRIGLGSLTIFGNEGIRGKIGACRSGSVRLVLLLALSGHSGRGVLSWGLDSRIAVHIGQNGLSFLDRDFHLRGLLLRGRGNIFLLGHIKLLLLFYGWF